MITLYTVPVSVYSAKLQIMMRHKSIAWDPLPPPGGYGSDAYCKMVPSGNIPAMIHNDFMLSDSEAIAEYLNEVFPDTPMMPEGLRIRAKAREKSRFHDTRLEPAVRALYPQVAFATRDADSVASGGAAITKHLASLDLLLKDDVLDPARLWLCDCGFAVTLAWIKAFEGAIDLAVTWPASVLDYQARLQKFPAVSDELIVYHPEMDTYLIKAKAPEA